MVDKVFSPGLRLDNGTYTGALGELQGGKVDTWMMPAYLLLDRFDDFLFTSPYADSPYSALISRERHEMVFVRFDGLLADINLSVYALFLLLLMCIWCIAIVNEKLQSGTRVNPPWAILSSMTPQSFRQWDYQNGITRKVLILAIGFALLLGTSYYSSKLLQELIVPNKIIATTLQTLINRIESGISQVSFEDENHEILQYIMTSEETDIRNLAEALKTHKTKRHKHDNGIEMLKQVLNDHMIAIDLTEYHYSVLASIPHKDCGQYELVPIDNLSKIWLSIILRKEVKRVLEPLNVIVAERFGTIQRERDTGYVDEECAGLLFPESIEPQFSALAMEDLSGVFALLVICILVSVITFKLEILFWKTCGHKTQQPPDSGMEGRLEGVQLSLNLKARMSSEHANVIMGKYRELTDLLAEHTNFEDI